MHGRAGPHGADKGCRVALFDPGPLHEGARPVGEGRGPVPLVACHRHQGQFAQGDRGDFGCAGFLADADRILQCRAAAVEVAGKELRDPLHERGRGDHEIFLREPARGLVGIGTHLLDPPPAQQRPEHGRPCFGRGVIGPGHVSVLPAIDQVGPSLGLDRPPG